MPPQPKTHPLASRRTFIGYPDREKGPFVIAAHWIEKDGRLVPVGVEVWKTVHPLPDDMFAVGELAGVDLQGLEATDLRQIPLATILGELWDIQRQAVGEVREVIDNTRPELADELEPVRFGGRYRRVSPDDVETFKQVAAIYQDEMRSPGRKRPTDAVARSFGVNHSTAAKWVKRARDLNLLPSTSPGRPSNITPATTKKGGKR